MLKRDPMLTVSLPLLLVLMAGCTSAMRDVRTAEKALARGEVAVALESFQRAEVRGKWLNRQRLGLAESWLLMGRPDRALEPARMARLSDLKGSGALYGQALLAHGRIEEAEQQVKGCDSSGCQRVRMEASQARGVPDLARSLCERETAVEQVAPETVGLCTYLAARGRWERREWGAFTQDRAHAPALGDLLAAGRLNGEPTGLDSTSVQTMAMVWGTEARLRHGAGDLEGALRLGHRALAAGLDDVDLAVLLGQLWLTVGEAERAIAEVDGVDSAEAWRVRIQGWAALGQQTKAADAMMELVRLDQGKTPSLWVELARALEAAERPTEAVAVWMQAANSGQQEALAVVVKRSIHAGQLQHAERYARHGLAVNPADGELMAALLEVLIRTDRHREAREQLNEARSVLPADSRWDVFEARLPPAP